jgi:hypothetical protein
MLHLHSDILGRFLTPHSYLLVTVGQSCFGLLSWGELMYAAPSQWVFVWLEMCLSIAFSNNCSPLSCVLLCNILPVREIGGSSSDAMKSTVCRDVCWWVCVSVFCRDMELPSFYPEDGGSTFFQSVGTCLCRCIVFGFFMHSMSNAWSNGYA